MEWLILKASPFWYITGEGKPIRNSEKIATWWENRIRTEHGVSLREGYSYNASTTPYTVEPQGRILVPATRISSVVNIFGTPIPSTNFNFFSPLNILKIPYKY